MNLQFDISTEKEISVLSLRGKIISDLDLEKLNHEFLKTNEVQATKWVFDFTHLTHINSSGMNFVIRSLTRSRINQGDVVLCSVQGNVKKLFEIAKLNQIFTVFEEISEAINHFKN